MSETVNFVYLGKYFSKNQRGMLNDHQENVEITTEMVEIEEAVEIIEEGIIVEEIIENKIG